jgi:hypothetical protein
MAKTGFHRQATARMVRPIGIIARLARRGTEPGAAVRRQIVTIRDMGPGMAGVEAGPRAWRRPGT